MKKPNYPPAKLDAELSKWAEQVRSELELREGSWQEAQRKAPEISNYRRAGLDGILKDTISKRSYLKLMAAGLRQTQLFEALLGTAVSGKKANWLKGLGKTEKQLRYFPERLKSIANEIESLNRHRLFAPRHWVLKRMVSNSSKEKFAARFEQLPHLIRCYAAFLASHSKDMKSHLKRKQDNTRNIKTLAQDLLIQLIREETGRDRPIELSNLLGAVASQAGSKRMEYSAEAIRMRAKRLRDRYRGA